MPRLLQPLVDGDRQEPGLTNKEQAAIVIPSSLSYYHDFEGKLSVSLTTACLVPPILSLFSEPDDSYR